MPAKQSTTNQPLETTRETARKFGGKLLFLLLALSGLLQASGLTNQVTIEEREGYRYIRSNGIPNHPTGEFPNPGNPNAISAQSHTFRVPINPQLTSNATPVRPVFGVALNGIPFEPGTAEAWQQDRTSVWRFEALTGFIHLGTDDSNAHVQPTGSYHYHGIPTGLLPEEPGVVHLGYGADGFPIYGPVGYRDASDRSSGLTAVRSSYRLKAGLRPDGPGGLHDGAFTGDFEYVEGLGDLDECNGRFGVTPEYPEGIYHYYLTETFPFVPRCVMGVVDDSFRRGARAEGAGAERPGTEGESRRPPRGPHGRRPPGGPHGRPPGPHNGPSHSHSGGPPHRHSPIQYEPSFPPEE